MKLKKSLLALTTAATVAVAGSTAAVAEENPAANGSNTGITNSSSQNDDNNDGEPGKKDPQDNGGKKKPSKLAGSFANFFGWTEKTEGLQKFKDVTALVTAVGALVAGIVTLANNFQKLGKLFK